MRKTSATTATDLVTGPVNAENPSKETLQEVTEDPRDPDLLLGQYLQSEEKDQERDHRLSKMTDKATRDLFLKALQLGKKRCLRRPSQSQ